MPDPETQPHLRERPSAPPRSLTPRSLCLLLLAIVIFVLVRWVLPFSESASIRTGLAILCLAAVLWLTEAIPLAITALLVPIVALLTGVFADAGGRAVADAFASFAHPLIFLFLGGFGIAAALSRQGLDRWIADGILRRAGGDFRRSAYALFLVAAGLSVWISNTAATALLLPVALGILSDLRLRTSEAVVARAAPFLLLGLAYSASVGGIGSKVGSPPNGIAANKLGMSFQDWLAIGIPCVLILLPCLFLLLALLARPGKVPRLDLTFEPFSFTLPRIGTLAIFLLAVAAWLSSSFLGARLGIENDFDTLVAIGALILLAACRFVRWKDINRTTDWGVLLLFGGGLTLSKILDQTGASAYLAGQLKILTTGWPLFLVIGAVVLFVIFLTELSSNTATAALFVPIFYEVAVALGVEPSRFVLPLAVAASCAFMLPVATPPNAIVFGSGRVPQRTMMRVGLVLNLAFAVILTLLSSFLF